MAVTALGGPTASRYIAGTSPRGLPENHIMAFEMAIELAAEVEAEVEAEVAAEVTAERTGRRIRRWEIWGLAACCWLASAEARAQDDVDGSVDSNVDGSVDGNVATSADRCSEKAPPKDPEAARVAFRAGQTAFSEGAYARAVALWDQAYRDDCSAHALLLNLAMAQELLGRPDAAIHTLRLFNRRSPESPYVEANERRIVRLEKEVADKGQPQTQAATESATAQAAAQPHAQGQGRSERPGLAPVERPAARVDDSSAFELPLVVTVTGGVVAVVGAVLYVEGRASAGSAEGRCGASRQACTDMDGVVDGERARSRAEVGGWLAGAGLGVAAGGLIWHFLSSPERPLDQASTEGLNLVADPSTGGARIGWAGRF